MSSRFYILFVYPNFGTMYDYLLKKCLLIVHCDFTVIQASAGFTSTQSLFAYLFKTLFRILVCSMSEFFSSA